MQPNITFVLGTRPEIIKLAPVIRECERRDLSFSLVHTGQHYSEQLDDVFFEQLRLPVPDRNLAVGSGRHGEQTGKMLSEIETELLETEPDVVLVQGDTNSVLAGGLAGVKLDGVEVGHVEAGLRSYNREMPEEINRRLVDHASDYLFAPTDDARENLLEESIADASITVTGNTVVDAVTENVDIAHEQSDVLETLDLPDRFALLTAHRAENVDDTTRFQALLDGVHAAATDHDLHVVYPIHPRAADRLEALNVTMPTSIRVVDPLDFLDFLVLQDTATVVLTDSGGVQEETCILGTPCVTLRDETERPETVAVGANQVVGTNADAIREAVEEAIVADRTWENPFGDGSAATQILDVLEANDD